MQKIRAKQALGYVFLPQVIPRFKGLFGSGFSYLALLMASIFQAARLLPPNHPYLNKANFGKYGIRHVFAEAGSRLTFSRSNIDQIAIFAVMLAGFVILILQCLLFLFALLSKPLLAMPFVGMFSTPMPDNDIALIMLDKVFGVPDFFGSSANPVGSPPPFNAALHALLQFYSMALLLVGAIVFLYYCFVVIAETAQTGTPFGRRFAHVWAPIRLVVALGLLVPINWGLNSAQYVVLMAAKMGSGFATNGWYQFNTGLTNALGVDDATLFARPKTPDTWPLTKFMMLAATCKESYERLGVTGIKPYLVKSPLNFQEATPFSPPYADVVQFYNYGDVLIRFGVQDSDKYASEPGGVYPFCGEVAVATGTKTDADFHVGAWRVQRHYYEEILLAWEDTSYTNFAQVMAYRVLNRGTCSVSGPGLDCDNPPSPEYVRDIRSHGQDSYEVIVNVARDQMVASGSLAIPTELLERGWGGAAIWYNWIAEVNGSFMGAIAFLPTPSLDPLPMQQVLQAKRSSDQNVSPAYMYEPNLSSGREVTFPADGQVSSEIHKHVMGVLWAAYQIIGKDELYVPAEAKPQRNVFLDTIDQFLGLNGLYSMRENTDIHPMAQLVALGKGIVDGAVRSLFVATVFSAGGGFAKAFGEAHSGLAGFFEVGKQIFMMTAMLGLTVGFVLYYVVPFLPFMYFFFALGSWVKTIFEAMVGAPLWALAHLRIDGDGLPGESAMDGYFMIFEIFVRPILTVFGLIGSLIIFAAMVKVLNGIFDLVVANLAGFDNNPCAVSTPGGPCERYGTLTIDVGDSSANPVLAETLEFKRSTVDEFFFTIIYTVIVYMIATSCFKLIDQVPQQILRWMGAGVRVFSDDSGDATEGLKRYAMIAGSSFTSNLAGGITGGVGNIAQGTGRMVASFKGSEVTPKGGGS